MSPTTPQAAPANSFDAPDKGAFRTPQTPETAIGQEPLALTRDEIAAIYARRELELKIASETPLYAQMLTERRAAARYARAAHQSLGCRTDRGRR
jgi:hypothetical protein